MRRWGWVLGLVIAMAAGCASAPPPEPKPVTVGPSDAVVEWREQQAAKADEDRLAPLAQLDAAKVDSGPPAPQDEAPSPAVTPEPEPIAEAPAEAERDPGIAWVKAHCKLYEPESRLTQGVCDPVCPPPVRIWPCPEYSCPAGANASWVDSANKQACAMQRGNASRVARPIWIPKLH